MSKIEIWVLMDENGNAVTSTDADTLHEQYDEEFDADDRNILSTRRIKVTLTVPLPKPIELVGTVPAEPTTGELRVA